MTKIVVYDEKKLVFDRASELEALIESASVKTISISAELLKSITHSPPDLILFSINTEDARFAELLQQMRFIKGCDNIPIIGIFEQSNPEMQLLALEAGITDFLPHSANKLELFTRVHSLLELYKLRHKLDSTKSKLTFLRTAIKHTPAHLAILDKNRKYIAVSDALAKTLNKSAAGMVGLKPENVLHPSDGAIRQTFEKEMLLNRAVQITRKETMVDYTGSFYDIMISRSPIRVASDEIIGLVSCGLIPSSVGAHNRTMPDDIDTLTGFKSAISIPAEIEKAVEHAVATGQSFALHSVCLEGLVEINTLYGRSVGDRLLVAASRRLQAKVADLAASVKLYARIWGNGFLLLQTGIHEENDIRQLSTSLASEMRKPFLIVGQDITTEITAQVLIYPNDGRTAKNLLKELFLVSGESGQDKPITAISSTPILIQHQPPQDMHKALLQALADNELRIFYQPQVSLLHGQMTGMEALLRWKRPGAGIVGPDALFKAASEFNELLPLTEWIFKQVLADMATFISHNISNFSCSINVSAEQLAYPEMASLLSDVLTHIPRSIIKFDLEIEASSLNANNPNTQKSAFKIIEALSGSVTVDCRMGDPLAILNQITTAIKRIKIPIESSFTSGHSLKKLVATAHKRDVNVIMCNVEHADHLAILRECLVDDAQGYFIQAPVSVEDFIIMSRSGDL